MCYCCICCCCFASSVLLLLLLLSSLLLFTMLLLASSTRSYNKNTGMVFQPPRKVETPATPEAAAILLLLPPPLPSSAGAAQRRRACADATARLLPPPALSAWPSVQPARHRHFLPACHAPAGAATNFRSLAALSLAARLLSELGFFSRGSPGRVLRDTGNPVSRACRKWAAGSEAVYWQRAVGVHLHREVGWKLRELEAQQQQQQQEQQQHGVQP